MAFYWFYMEHTMNATLGKNKGETVVKVVGCSCGGLTFFIVQAECVLQFNLF